MDMRPHASSRQTGTAAQRQGRARTWIRAALGAALILALLWLLLAPSPIPVETATVAEGPMQVAIHEQGRVQVHDRYILAAPVAGNLKRIDLHDGDPVTKGQVVAILEPLPMDVRAVEEATARLQAAQARAIEAGQRSERAHADLQLAGSEHARIERLAREGFISPQATDKAANAEAAARAEWNAARSREQAAIADAKAAEAALLSANLPASMKPSQLRLTTPVDGYILKVHEKSERTVSAGMPLATIGDPARYEIVVDVLSTDAVKVTRGDTMLLEGWGGGKMLEARVRLVEPVAFTKVSALGVEEQRVNVIADPVDSLGALGDGYRVEARIVIWSGKRVTKVPGSSVFRSGQAWHVFTVEGGHAREREVRIGQRNQDEVQILSGVEVGAAVIRYPDNQIEDGARLRPVPSR